MALSEICKFCNQSSIPRRIKGRYIGSKEQIKIWECRNCKALWSDN